MGVLIEWIRFGTVAEDGGGWEVRASMSAMTTGTAKAAIQRRLIGG